MAIRKVIRTVWNILPLVGTLAIVCIWVSLGVIAASQPDEYSGYAIGYSRLDNWAVTIVARSDGFVLGQYFEPYLGERSGLWGHKSRANYDQPFTMRRLVPTFRRGRVAPAVEFHLSLPLLLFGSLTGFMWIMPMTRRYFRRRRGLCMRCGYDLTGNQSGVCSECGNKSPL